MVPLYLPLTLDEEDQSRGTPIFFNGISVYLAQNFALFREAPAWLRNLFGSRSLLQWAAGKAARTRPQDLGELTLSMLRGESGNQARELDQLVAWLKTQPPPDVINLSNALLLGLSRRLKFDLGAPLVCTLQGEDSFLDALPEPHRAQCWQLLAERAADVDLFVAPSRYFAELMRKRLNIPADRLRVVFNGINLDGFGCERTHAAAPPTLGARPSPPVLGYFARMCREKGLDTLIEAFIALRMRGQVNDLKLRIGGSCGPADELFVNSLRQRLQAANLLGEAEFHPNLDRAAKLQFLRSLSVFSVPASYGEAFGLYVIEALAVGVPVIQPRTAAFPELIETTGGGRLCSPGDPHSLAETIEELLLTPGLGHRLGETGRRTVMQQFSAVAMAQQILGVYQEVVTQGLKTA